MKDEQEAFLSAGSTGLWREFQAIFAEFAGISIQAFDGKGSAPSTSPALPSLCAVFQRYPETRATCLKECFHKAATCRVGRKIIAERCYAGLSYRLVPIRRGNRPHGIVIVGRVLTEVFGGEQCLGVIERYKVPREAFMEGLAGVRTMGASGLDRVAAAVRKAAVSLIAAEARRERSRSRTSRRDDLLHLARQALAFSDGGPDGTGKVLGLLARLVGVPGAAILLTRDGQSTAEVHSSVGLGEDVLHVLAGQDWGRLLGHQGASGQLVLQDHREMLRAGFDLPGSSLAAQRLDHGCRAVGCLVVSGAALSTRGLALLEEAATFVAARVAHLKCRESLAEKDEDARLLGLMAEQCLTAQSVEELLPLALESAMRSLRARRGSIFLAEGRGRITARALRGVHAPVSDTMDVLRPDSVSHRVFFNVRPLLVQDVGKESGLGGERQFPYASRSFVSVPLRENGHALGVLHLTEREGEEVFTARDLSLLERLSLQASGVICKVQLEKEVQELRIASTTDHLTGVRNRRFLEDQLAVEFQRARRFGQPLSVAMLDVDEFKGINDQVGHDYGDLVLKAIADAVRSQLRSVDIVARYGGDEFVIVLPGTGADGARDTIEKVRSRVETLVLPPAGSAVAPRRLTVSIGISVYPGSANAAEDLLWLADQSLLDAKRGGKNTTRLRTD